MKIRVVIYQAEEGGYWAEVPALPGCFTQGESMEEVLHNLREAITCHLDAAEKAAPAGATVREIEV